MNGNYEKLKVLLKELFQLDQSDLDFGIYRIMNQKHDEIVRFLDNDLLPQVRDAFKASEADSKAAIEAEIQESIEAAKKLGADPETLPKVKELRAKLAQAVDVSGLENEVYSDLCNFFRRYYNEGDFLSLRRYKEGVYAIPYEGEEVKLHWANHDQYYIKTSEYFRDYSFKLPNGKKVHFKIVEADTEKDNTKAEAGKERRFILASENPVSEENGDLCIRFVYRPDPAKRKQDTINKETADIVLGVSEMADQLVAPIKKISTEWLAELAKPAPTEKYPQRTLLEKRLADYTARNTFDYFVHKNLGRFLRRELDLFIKSEVLHLEDIVDENVTPRDVDEKMLNKIRAIRKIARKIIDFLAQLEDFQKKLWLKKKFVVETGYCITLDRIPQSLYSEIAANDEQRKEWVRLYSINEIRGDLATPAYSEPLTVEFLKSQPFLMLDTKFFAEKFKTKLLASIEDVESKCDGLMLYGDNFHALNVIGRRYAREIQCIHIDPPYNTQTSGFLYPNTYQHSSWLTMMRQVTEAAMPFLSDDGSFLCHIDENEYELLHTLLENMTPQNGGTVIWDKKNPMLGREGIATQHEYIIWKTKTAGPVYLRNATFRMIMETAKNIISKHGAVSQEVRTEFSKWISSHPGLTGGERSYRFIEDDGRVYQSVGMGAPEQRTDPKFFKPLFHPVTKKPCPVPSSGWSRAPDTMTDLIRDGLIIFGEDETVQPRRKVYLTDESQRQVSSVIQESGRGKADVEKLGLEFPYCHPLPLYVELVGAAAPDKFSTVLDFFAGSGTNGDAVVALNREDCTKRKYILVEVGEQFEKVLKPRIQKIVFSNDWKDGKPVFPSVGKCDGVSHMFKYMRLESYEDTLNNLELKRTVEQSDLLTKSAGLRESYTLSYMMDFESSESLLNVRMFDDPFNYRLNIATGSAGETRPVAVDLVETFNWLIGLRVKHVDVIRGVKVIEGKGPKGERVLVLWRVVKEMDGDRLDDWFRKQGYNTKDMEFDLIYVNGDNNLENLRRADQTWKVRLIEEDFHRLMFECKDV